ncbi:MAG: hypothetical protein ABW187_04580 [Dokdonella sp.]
MEVPRFGPDAGARRDFHAEAQKTRALHPYIAVANRLKVGLLRPQRLPAQQQRIEQDQALFRHHCTRGFKITARARVEARQFAWAGTAQHLQSPLSQRRRAAPSRKDTIHFCKDCGSMRLDTHVRTNDRPTVGLGAPESFHQRKRVQQIGNTLLRRQRWRSMNARRRERLLSDVAEPV